MANAKETSTASIRNLIFGVENCLATTVGFLSGAAVVGISRRVILLTGIVLITVEAFSMAVKSFLSSRPAEQHAREVGGAFRRPLVAGVAMFASSLLAGCIPLAPYFLAIPRSALPLSVALSLGFLFALGMASARVFRIAMLRKALEMLLVGGAAAAAGILIGNLADRIRY